MDLDQFKRTYFQECTELLSDAEFHLMALENGGGDADTMNAVFRAVHSIKGGAGAFGFTRLVGFAHIFETALDSLRNGNVPASRETIELMLRSRDLVADLVAAAQQDVDATPGMEDEAKAALG
ncbi:MAG: Hpt domain-containing protein, partial [Rhodospirillales bacterium]|nr:Hpt domain-containing protein [Rhodospirillales bacterium]